MKFSTSQTLQEIAAIIGVSYVGDPMFPVTGMNEIHVVTPGDIVFVEVEFQPQINIHSYKVF